MGPEADLAVVDSGLKLVPQHDSRLDDVSPVDLDAPAPVEYAVPSREHNPNSAPLPLNPVGHSGHGRHQVRDTWGGPNGSSAACYPHRQYPVGAGPSAGRPANLRRRISNFPRTR